MEELLNEIKTELAAELSGDPEYNETALTAKIKNAYREVKRARNYGAVDFTDDEINADMEQFYSNIRNIALYDYNQIGAELETNHSENGVSRTYVDRLKLFSDVIPFAKLI